MSVKGLRRKTTLKVAGGVLVATGLILMPVPVLPGWPLVIAGLALIRKARKSQVPDTSSVTALPTPTAESDAASA